MKRQLEITVTSEGGKAKISIIGRIADWKDSALNFQGQVEDLISKGVTDCELYLRSEGGDVWEANDISNIIKKFPGTITGKGGSLVASAATYIAIACKTFSMPSNGLFMIHKPSYAPFGNADEIRAQLKMLDLLTSDYCKAYACKTGMKETDIEQLWIEDCWMGSAEAMDKKFIDSISDEEPVDQVTLDQVKAICKKVPTAFLKSTITQESIHPNQNDTMDKKMLCVVLALASTTVEAEKITDAEVLAAISGLKAKADQADGLKVEVSALKAERDNSKITALIAGAIENKQILPAEKPHFEKLAKDDFPTAEALINARPKVTSISKELNDHSNPAPEDRTGWKYKDYMEKDPQALAKMAKDDLSKFKPLFKEHYGMEYTD